MRCSRCTGACSCSGSTVQPGCTSGGPAPTSTPLPANTQPLDSLACSLLGGLQGLVDAGRRIAHEVGARPYRVRLVWQQQDQVTGYWSEVYSRELIPVRVEERNESLSPEAAGQVPSGALVLREVSPVQVDEWMLRGYLQGQPWGADEPTREFFYEVQALPRCAGDPEPDRYRYVLGQVPTLRSSSMEWEIRLVSAFGRRLPDGADSTVPSRIYPTEGARLVP